MNGGNTVNNIPARGIYPSFGTQTLGIESSAGSVDASSAGPKSTSKPLSEVEQAAAIGATGNTIITFGVILVGLVALMFLAQRIGSESTEFKTIRLSFYNMIVIAFAAVLGINFFKAVFTRIKVPGVSSFFLAA